MKSSHYKNLGRLAVAVGFLCAASLSTHATILATQNSGQISNGGVILTPDAGASFVLLAMGFSGLAIAARKRFKR